MLDYSPWEAIPKSGDESAFPASPSRSLCLDDSFGLFQGRNAYSSQDQGYLSPQEVSTITPIISGTFQPFSQGLRFNSNVTFSYYSFLHLRNLATLQPDDVRYLEAKGCLHVPTSPYIDQFIRHYFLYVHPCMPILDEGDFWDMYSSKPDETNKAHGISLLVFQAMLFGASTVGIALLVLLKYAKRLVSLSL